MGRYSMPKPSATERVARDTRRRRRGPVVRGPEDLVFSDQVRTPARADDRELTRARERALELEGALTAATELERRAGEELARVREDRREELERARAELVRERERHATELAELRTRLDQRERELRTLVLEMGKTQGRLEVAERRLVEAGAPAPGASTGATTRGDRWQSWVALALMLAIGLFGASFLVEVVRYELLGAEATPEVRADGPPEARREAPAGGRGAADGDTANGDTANGPGSGGGPVEAAPADRAGLVNHPG